MWRKIWSVLIAAGLWQGAGLGQAVEDQPGDLYSIFDRLTQRVGEHPKENDFYPVAEELLWDVYPQGDSLKAELVHFVKHGEEGPRLCFAGLALISFRDAATVRPMLERALEAHASPETRKCFRKAAAQLLNMPAVGYGNVKEGVEHTIDENSNEFLQELMKDADTAAKSSIGHLQAQRLHEMIVRALGEDEGESDFAAEAVAYSTGDVAGVLDLKDERLLEPALTFPDSWVFQNMIQILGYAVNRDFLGKLAGKSVDEFTPEEMKRASKAAGVWWQKYLREHPDGDWRPAVIAGFVNAGYKVENDYSSFRSQQELLRALDDGDRRIRYNAYQLFNETYKTHFDLDFAFGENYNCASLETTRDNHAADNEARLKRYWQKRLGGGTVE